MIHLDLTESEAKTLRFALDRELYLVRQRIGKLQGSSRVVIQARNKWHVLYAKLTMIREKLS